VVVLLEFEQTQDQISQSGHGLSGITAGDLGDILPQGDVATVMGAVFTGGPMATNVLSQLLGGRFLLDQAGDIEAILLGLINDLPVAQFLAITPDGDELPASGQAGLLRID